MKICGLFQSRLAIFFYAFTSRKTAPHFCWKRFNRGSNPEADELRAILP